MKVSYKMIDKQLRLRGFLFNLLVSRSSEDKYIKLMRTVKKLTSRQKGQKVDGLEMTEEWITREDGSKLRVCVYKPLHLKGDIPEYCGCMGEAMLKESLNYSQIHTRD